MPPIIFEMKILNYTFELPKLELVDGELVETGTIEEKHTFTLLFKGIGIYEEMANKPLLTSLMSVVEDGEVTSNAVEKILSKDFISNLACASYVKIENGKFHNNRGTAEEFKKTNAYSEIFRDFDFITQLIEMAVDCIKEESVKKAREEAKSKANVNSKKA